MKKLIFVLSILFQTVVVFSQNHSFVSSLPEDIWKLVPGRGGSFYTVSWEPNCPNDFITIRFFQRDGSMFSSFKSPGYIGSFNSICGTTDSLDHLVLYLRINDINHLMYAFDSTGTVLWNNNLQYTSPQVKFTKIILSPSGYLLCGNTISGTTDTSRAILTKISRLGEHEWSRYYALTPLLTANLSFNDVMIENDSLLLVGQYFFTDQYIGHAPYRPIVCKTDTMGNIGRCYYYMVDSTIFGFDEYQFVQIEKSPSGNYFLVGNNSGNEHALFKMNSSYNIVWIREKLSGRSTAMCAGYNDDVFISPDVEYGNFVMQFNGNGQVISNHLTKTIPGDYNNSNGQLKFLFRYDCGFLMANNHSLAAHCNKSFAICLDSTKTNVTNYYNVNLFYRKNKALISGFLNTPYHYLMTTVFTPLQEPLSILCHSAYTCEESSGVESNEAKEWKLYPNPTSHFVTIEPAENGSNYTVEIFNSMGQKLQESEPESGTCHFSTESFGKGIIFVKISQQNKVVQRKIMITQ
jgi:hypothetical protein